MVIIVKYILVIGRRKVAAGRQRIDSGLSGAEIAPPEVANRNLDPSSGNSSRVSLYSSR